jgi:capsular exopolysaccharide synthesis family protein
LDSRVNSQASDESAITQDQPLSGLINGVVALRRHVLLVVLCAVIVPVVAVAYAVHKPKVYTAKASLLFRDPGFVQQLLGSAQQGGTQDPAVEEATNNQLLELPVVASLTSDALNRKLTAAQVTSDISVSNDGQSNVATVTASNPDPRLAARLANAYAQQFTVFRREADRAKVESAIGLIQREIAGLPADAAGQRQALQRYVNQLQVVAALQSGNAEVVQAAQVPASPASPKPTMDGVLGLGLGLLMGLGLALLFERLDRRLKDPGEIARAFERPILALIPQISSLGRHGRRDKSILATRTQSPPSYAEAFRMLRANLRYFNVDRQVQSVLITSSVPGDGKTTVALNLALAAAESGTRTLLVEANWRHPTIGDWLGIPDDTGLSLVLAGEVEVALAIARVPLDAGQSNGNGRSLDVLLAGPPPPNPSDLADSMHMRELIAGAERSYELVVIDTPATPVVSDAVPLVNVVSGVVVVAAVRNTTRESAARLRTQLANLGAHVLGVVVNSLTREPGRDFYTYAREGGDYQPSSQTRTALADVVDAGQNNWTSTPLYQWSSQRRAGGRRGIEGRAVEDERIPDSAEADGETLDDPQTKHR